MVHTQSFLVILSFAVVSVILTVIVNKNTFLLLTVIIDDRRAVIVTFLSYLQVCCRTSCCCVVSDAASVLPKSDAGEHHQIGQAVVTPHGGGQTPTTEFTGHASGGTGMRPAHVPDDRESRPVNTASAASTRCVDNIAAQSAAATITRPPSLMTAAVQPTVAAPAATVAAAAATATGTEMPASMKEGSLVLMYGDCCPGKHCTRASDVPNQVTFALTYVEAHDSHFFWAALLFGKRVCCNLLL